MKQFYTLKFACLLILVFAGLMAKAQKFRMVKDINASTDANPSNYQWPTTPAYAVLNGVAYFSANDGINGGGLWRSDGTANGTTLIKSIAPDTTGTLIQNITPYKNTVIFSVTDQTRNQIWVSDGTSAGTKIVKDLPYKNYDPTQFTIINGLMYFVYSGNFYADQLWRTDGTEVGTIMVSNLYDASFNYAYGISNLTNYNETAYFSVSSNNGGCLVKSDGTSVGTSVVYSGFDVFTQPVNFTLLNNTIYFGASKNSSGGLWETDGTTAGTQLVAGSNGKIDLNQLSTQYQFPIIKNSLYFSFANNLYIYNTKNNDGIQLVSIVNQALGVNYLNNLTSVNDSLIFFNTTVTAKTSQLWRSDGTSAGTVLIKEIPGTLYSFFQNFYAFNKTLFFSCYGDNLGFELWKSDGSVAGTQLVKDINPGIYSSNPSYCSAFGSILLLQANDGTTGYELWKSDGTENGTTIVKDINKSSTASAYPTLYPMTGNYILANNNQLIFEAFDDLHGIEIWKSDGSIAGTSLLKDVIPGYESGLNQFSLLTNFKNNSYFFAQTITDTISVWKTDGTSSGTVLAQHFTDSINSVSQTGRLRPLNIKGGDSLLFIELYDPSYNYNKLYATDGAFPAKPVKLDIPFHGILDNDLYVLGNTAFFFFTDENGVELWKSDGSVGGTVQIKNITSNASLSYANMYTATVYNNKFYFLPNNATANYLWVSDGTAAGTNVLKGGIQVYPYTDFTISGNKLYFLADDGITGNELWVTDGTENGTQLVKDANPGVNPSSFGSIVDVNGTVFFTANDGIHGNELWKSDGTAAGTVMVKDISTGSAGTNIQNMVSAGTSLYFLIDGILWTSDGTETGTVAVNDTGLQGLRIINGLTAAADKLYFSAYTYKYGQELYVGDANNTLPVTLLAFTGQWAKKDAQLAWVTTNEFKNSHFNIQRSITGMNFTTIGQVNSKGSAVTKNNYSYTDVDAADLGGKSVYYRLQQVDLDGKVNYSNIVQLNTAASNNITISPNPAQKTAFIVSTTNIIGALITVTDMGGHVVYSGKQNLFAGSPSPVDVSGLAAGMYNVTIQNGADNKQQFKLIVK